jgi:hypothetical protein
MRIIFTLLFVCLLAPGALEAQENIQHQSLKGAREFDLVIENVAGAVPVADSVLKANAERRLNEEGLVVNEEAGEYLYVNLAGIEMKPGGYAWTLRLEFRRVCLKFDPILDLSLQYASRQKRGEPVNVDELMDLLQDRSMIVLAATWSTGTIAVSPASACRDHVLRALDDKLDAFITAWYAANRE